MTGDLIAGGLVFVLCFVWFVIGRGYERVAVEPEPCTRRHRDELR